MATRVGKVSVHKHLHHFRKASFAQLTSIFIRTNAVSKSGTGETKDYFMPCKTFTQMLFFYETTIMREIAWIFMLCT